MKKKKKDSIKEHEQVESNPREKEKKTECPHQYHPMSL
jgi:hypothetical protein